MVINESGKKTSITISIGISGINLESGQEDSTEMLIHRADQAMYDAKISRNSIRSR